MMKINIRNLTDSNKRICLVPRNGNAVTLPNPPLNPTVGINDAGEVYMCLSPYVEDSGISCAGAISTASFQLWVGEAIDDSNFTMSVNVNGLTASPITVNASEVEWRSYYEGPADGLTTVVDDTIVTVFPYVSITEPNIHVYYIILTTYVIPEYDEEGEVIPPVLNDKRVSLGFSSVGSGVSMPPLLGMGGGLPDMDRNPTIGLSGENTVTVCLKPLAPNVNEIYCVGATYSTGCIDFEGSWDVEIDGELVAEDVVFELPEPVTLPLLLMGTEQIQRDPVDTCNWSASESRPWIELFTDVPEDFHFTLRLCIDDDPTIHTVAVTAEQFQNGVNTDIPIVTTTLANIIRLDIYAYEWEGDYYCVFDFILLNQGYYSVTGYFSQLSESISLPPAVSDVVEIGGNYYNERVFTFCIGYD